MFDLITYSAPKIQLFMLVLLRASGVFLLAPIFGHAAVPSQFKIALLLLLTIVVMSTVSDTSIPQVASIAELSILAFKELLVGLMIGFVFIVLFWGVQAAGSIAGYQMGLTIASVVDPSTNQEQSTIGQFWLLVALVIFFGINGHHLIIRAFHDSYAAVPAGQVAFNGTTGELAIKYSAYSLVIALKVAAPVIVTMFLTDVALGVISKLLPTMNVFIVSFGLKIAIGLAVMALSLPMFAYVLEKGTIYLNDQLTTVLASMGKA
jgi:flagellar biosynthetic protein FliR